jgi:hypothetical protein
MAISLRHGFGSGKLDGTDDTLVQPSNWNSEHVLAIGVPKLFGRTTAIGTSGTITLLGVTVASVGVFSTTAAHGLLAGQVITIAGATGMTQINSDFLVVSSTNLTSTNFSVTYQGTLLNTSTFSAYTANSGTITKTDTGVAEEIAVTGTGSAVLNNTPSITNPTITNYTETRYPATITGNAITLALTDGTFQTITTMVGANAITLPSPSTAGKSLTVQVVYASTPTSLTFSSPSGTLKYPGGTTPTATLTNTKSDFYSFIADGTNWYGVQTGANF